MALYHVHNIKYYNREVKSIICMSHEPKTKKLALARDDHSIEIWNIVSTPFIEYTMYNCLVENINSLLWIGSRLFSTCYRDVIEYNLNTLKIKHRYMAIGGEVTCMDVNHEKSHLAIGTKYGCINIYTVHENELISERIIDRHNDAILCIKWDNTDKMIYTGSINSIIVWNAISGRMIRKIMNEIKSETIFWCLAVTDDNIIVSGDSQGFLCFWDPRIGALIESYKSHTADILAVTLSHDKNVVYCTGIDPVVRTFCRIMAKSNDKFQWVKGSERKLHIHDVRALVENNGKLYSAGVDGYLVVSSCPPKNLVKYRSLTQSSHAIVCQKKRCIMLRYPNHLELWKLSLVSKDPEFVDQTALDCYNLDDESMMLLRVDTEDDENIISWAIDNDLRMIVYSTDTHMKIVNLIIDNNMIEKDMQLFDTIRLLDYYDTNLSMKGIQKMLFSPDSKLFVTINNYGDGNMVTLYKVGERNLKHIGSFQTTKESISKVGLACFSPDSKYLVCADWESRIAIYFIGEGVTSALKAWQLPKYSCPPTAMAVQKETLNLVVVYSDHKIVEYNIPSGQCTQFSDSLQRGLPRQWLARQFPIMNILFDPHNENVIIMHDDSGIYIINKNTERSTKKTEIMKDEKSEFTEDDNSLSTWQAQDAFLVTKKHLIHLDWLNDKKLVALVMNPILKEMLPPMRKELFLGA